MRSATSPLWNDYNLRIVRLVSRGYIQAASTSHVAGEVKHVTFVVHGIGAKLNSKTIFDNINRYLIWTLPLQFDHSSLSSQNCQFYSLTHFDSKKLELLSDLNHNVEYNLGSISIH